VPQGETGAPAYFLLHVPRTGGNTIATHLRAHLGEGFWSPGRPSALAMLGGRRYRLDGARDFARVRAVGGHYLGRSLERRFQGREIRRTLLLRDPVGFHVSYYNHRMMFSLSRGGPVCDFERHLRGQPRDLVALLLLWYWLELPLARLLATGDEQKYRLINEALAGFWFVGGHHDGDRLLAAIAADLGLPPGAMRRNTTVEWHKRVGWQPLRADDLPPATREAILAHNPIHDALWRSWRDAGLAPADVVAQPFSLGSGEMGMRDLLRSVLADRVIAPIWRKAARAIRARDWTAAARHYRKALRRVPGQPEVWAQYGHALREAGDAAGAEAAYRRAIALDPQIGEWHLFLGQALARQGREAEAREAYRQFERLDPDGLQRKRDELVALGHPEESVRAFWHSATGQGLADDSNAENLG
jgi:tetratricopeptide (TPR) repeat protein